MKRGRLRPRSDKRISEQQERQDVRELALARAGYRCSVPDGFAGVRCWGPLDVDEIAPRGVRPGGHLDDDNVQVLCRGHHDWKGEHPKEAHALGLRRWSWEDVPDS